MEQSIESNKKPVFAAGTDPAFIPGLTAPTSVGSQDGGEAAGPVPGDRGPGQDTAPGTPEDAKADAAEDVTADAVTETEAKDARDGTGAEEVAADADGAGDDDRPVFEVSDRRGSIRVGPEGIRFTLDDQEAEFDWSEVGAVESRTARFGRRFTITVHLSSRRWFNAEVEAESRDRLKSWPDELDVVLDAYFEES